MAAASSTPGSSASGGPIYTSTNAGASWIQTSAPSFDWRGLASSADGTRLLAVADSDGYGGGQIYTSTNAGGTWQTNDAPITTWYYAASSADGGRLLAVQHLGGVYTLQSVVPPSLSIARSGGNILLSWVVPSMSYVLKQNSDLSTTNWTVVPGTATLNYTNLRNQLTIPAPAVSTYYRLVSR